MSGKKNNKGAIGFEYKLWKAADKLRNNMDAAEYKHVVLGLIFQKYISDAFEEKYQTLKEEEFADEVIDIFSALGLQKPEIFILSEEFLNEVKNLKHKNLAIELLYKLLDDQVKSRSKKNLVQSRSFADLLKKAIIKYQSRTIEATAILEELLQLDRDIQKAQEEGKKLGLSDDEVAFYQVLSQNESALIELGDETLKKIAKELVASVRKYATIDFTVKKSVQARMRITIKRLLKKYRYPPERGFEINNGASSIIW